VNQEKKLIDQDLVVEATEWFAGVFNGQTKGQRFVLDRWDENSGYGIADLGRAILEDVLGTFEDGDDWPQELEDYIEILHEWAFDSYLTFELVDDYPHFFSM